METTFSMFSAPQSRTMPQSLGFGPQPKEREKLTIKYQPRTLAAMVGQGFQVDTLQRFASRPYPTAFLFAGDTGVGKTTAALALARELGCDDLYTLSHIASGDLNDERVDSELKMLRFCAPKGGWKILILDEADGMSPKARQRFLTAMEQIPPRSVIIFTTNHEKKFERRFLDRCEVVRFDSEADTHVQDAQIYLGDVWRGEGMPGDPPDVRTIEGLVDNGAISYRRVAQWVEGRRRELPDIVEVNTMAAPTMAPPVETVADPVGAPMDATAPSLQSVRSTGTDPDSLDWAEIARLSREGVSQKRLAQRFGVSHGCVFSRLKRMAASAQQNPDSPVT